MIMSRIFNIYIMIMINKIKEILVRWDWMLFLSILIYMIVPKIYDSYNIYLIGNSIPNTSALPIIAQWSFVALAIEVIQESTVLSLFFFVGSKIGSNSNIILQRIKTSISSIVSLTLILSITIFIFSDYMVEIIGTPKNIAELTSDYLRIKSISIPFSILSIAVIVLAESLNMKKIILIITILKLFISVILDSVFFGGYFFSLGLGVLGVAISNLLAEILIFLLTIYFVLFSLKMNFTNFFKLPFFKDWKILFHVGGFSGLDSLIRNLAYSFMIIRLVNLIGEKEIGGYYLALHIFWGFALVPALAFAESAKAFLSNSHDNNFIKRFISAIFISSILALLFSCIAPFWNTIATFFNKDMEVVKISYTVFSILLVPYILFIFNTVCDSIFYALGKTKYMAYQALLTNGTVYLLAFLLYINNIWHPTLETIMVLFALGILVDSVFTALFSWKVLSKKYFFKTS